MLVFYNARDLNVFSIQELFFQSFSFMPDVIKIDPHSPDNSLLKDIADRLSPGKLIVYPTETFYALGGLCADSVALEKIFNIKGRDPGKPLPLLIRDHTFLQHIANNFLPQALHLSKKFWPGPLTLLFNAASNLSPYITGNSRKVACRVSGSIVAQGLMAHLPEPLTSTSANFSGEESAIEIKRS